MQYLSDSTCAATYEEMSSEEDTSEEGDDDSGTQSQSLDEWPASMMPGCSKGKDHAKLWTMSTSMMQAYLALKGRGTDESDPLLRWIARQDDDFLENGGAMGYVALLDELQPSCVH